MLRAERLPRKVLQQHGKNCNQPPRRIRVKPQPNGKAPEALFDSGASQRPSTSLELQAVQKLQRPVRLRHCHTHAAEALLAQFEVRAEELLASD